MDSIKLLRETCAVEVRYQATLVHPGMIKGCRDMACGACLGLDRKWLPWPQGMHYAAHLGWGCPEISQ